MNGALLTMVVYVAFICVFAYSILRLEKLRKQRDGELSSGARWILIVVLGVLLTFIILDLIRR